MTHRPTDDVSNAMTFYAALGLDVRYFAALWHTFNVGHILATDLDRICPYMVIVNPADACWNGGPADAFDTTGLRLHEVMDDGRWPVIG